MVHYPPDNEGVAQPQRHPRADEIPHPSSTLRTPPMVIKEHIWAILRPLDRSTSLIHHQSASRRSPIQLNQRACGVRCVEIPPLFAMAGAPPVSAFRHCVFCGVSEPACASHCVVGVLRRHATGRFAAEAFTPGTDDGGPSRAYSAQYGE
ncbi:hypothetical protein BU26DRAFT_582773 [Trematosphaeria pertusa]|uniref:Uncharacterized protein n=1 Tax=Trematosphaeria pertusa TaxID=390896 RepID=A0A6A6IWI0_9PLEO|nr:uncharacterized protein BU26DRAFT_582773 [Trematosphaeria pertusa]KAF2254292.1 hypothetical protein BU26DRAFT_582773 [Trematosphaeria pertusa]